jgi:hypothetical protein
MNQAVLSVNQLLEVVVGVVEENLLNLLSCFVAIISLKSCPPSIKALGKSMPCSAPATNGMIMHYMNSIFIQRL